MISNAGALGGSLTDVGLWPQQQQQQQPNPVSQSKPRIPASRQIPMAFFGRGTGSLLSATLDDPDGRSCDRRHPDASPAYVSVRKYIRDNELMPTDRVESIYRWLDSMELQPAAASLFVYDPAVHWYRMDSLD
uniref:Uncharacterized protein n=1 Tax=Macrostomum lignano TaxID=282301 RepID=A0A1I8JB74_9PLAT